MSQVTRITLWRCSLDVFVFVIVFVFAYVFVIVFFFFGQVMFPHHCLKGHKSPGSLCNVKRKSQSVSVSQWQGHLLSCCRQLKRGGKDHLGTCFYHLKVFYGKLTELKQHKNLKKCKWLALMGSADAVTGEAKFDQTPIWFDDKLQLGCLPRSNVPDGSRHRVEWMGKVAKTIICKHGRWVRMSS